MVAASSDPRKARVRSLFTEDSHTRITLDASVFCPGFESDGPPIASTWVVTDIGTKKVHIKPLWNTSEPVAQ
jgi:hypothetical protein